MAKRIHGVGGVVGAVVAATLGTAVGCGDGFASDDCRTSHTCPSAAGEPAVGGASDGNDTTAGGAGGRDGTPLGGAAPTGGASDGLAGAGGADVVCRVDADCSNDIAEDGAEVCDNGECLAGNPPPTVVSSTPANDEVDVEPDTSIVIEFSEPLDPKTVTSTTIQVLDGTTPVPGELVYEDDEVTFTPASPLTLLAPYTLLVTTGVTDAEGAPLLTELSSTFQVRDGAWKTIDVVKGEITGMSDTLPMTSTGRALVAWNGTGLDRCPATAKWFLRGEADDVVRTFPTNSQPECEHISAGANAAGVAGVVWVSPNSGQGVTVQQYRAEGWLATASLLVKNPSAQLPRLAVAPSGAMTVFEHDTTTGSFVWTTDADGNWPATGALPGTGARVSLDLARSPTSAAFDSLGRGWAVWKAQAVAAGKEFESIVASRLPTARGNWATAKDLPGGVAAAPPDESTGETRRGAPVVALDGQGDPLVLWVDGDTGGTLMASRYVLSAWTAPKSVSPALVVDEFHEPPALAFDGQAFVAAWTAQEAGKYYTYTARYDLKTGWDAYQKQQTVAADGTSAAKMPRLVSDGRGNLLLVYAKGQGSSFTLVYQRYANGAWGDITPVPGGTVSTRDFGYKTLALSMSSNGLAALAWANYGTDFISSIRLASFY